MFWKLLNINPVGNIKPMQAKVFPLLSFIHSSKLIKGEKNTRVYAGIYIFLLCDDVDVVAVDVADVERWNSSVAFDVEESLL